jgi:hypothetical protein
MGLEYLMNNQRQLGFEAWELEEDLKAVEHFRRSTIELPEFTLEWAISMRLYGLALIQVQREVEGTFMLEKADAVLEQFGHCFFDEESYKLGMLPLVMQDLKTKTT